MFTVFLCSLLLVLFFKSQFALFPSVSAFCWNGWLGHWFTSTLISLLASHTLRVLFQTEFLGVFCFVFNMDRVRIFQIFKFLFPFQFISLFLHFAVSRQEEPSWSFNTSLWNLSLISNFITHKFYLPQNTRIQTEFSQDFLLLYKDHLSPLFNNMFLISVQDLVRMAFIVQIFTNIMYMIAYVFSKKMESFPTTLLFSSWGLIRITFKITSW